MLDTRETIHVASDAWHLRLSDWYISSHPRAAIPKEDLCHYFWTDVWAVLYWFFKVGAWWGIAPVFYAIVGLTLAIVGYALLLWPEVTSQVLLSLAGLAVSIALAGGMVYLLSCYESFDRRTQRIVKVVFAPLWIPLLLLATIVYGAVEGIKWIDRQWQKRLHKSFWSWFFTSHKFYLINPWLITTVLTLTTLTAIFGFESVWEVARLLLVGVAIIVGGIIAAVIIVVIVFLVGSFLKEKWQDWQYRRSVTRIRRAAYAQSLYHHSGLGDISSGSDEPPVAIKSKPRGTSSYRVIWQFLVATKHRFCPYIEIVRA